MSIYIDHNDYIHNGWILESPKSPTLFSIFVEVLNTMLRNGTIIQSDNRPDNNQTTRRTEELDEFEDEESVNHDTTTMHTLRYYQLLSGVRRNSEIQINLVTNRGT